MKIKVSLILLLIALCANFIKSEFSLTLKSERGTMKLKNFQHLHGHRLKVQPLTTVEVDKEMKCTTSCMRSEKCFSFNVKKVSPVSFLCELLSTSKFLDFKNLTREENFVHWYVKVSVILRY